MQRVRITIDKDGNVSYQVEGMTGQTCWKTMAVLLQVLSHGELEDFAWTEEAYQTEEIETCNVINRTD